LDEILAVWIGLCLFELAYCYLHLIMVVWIGLSLFELIWVIWIWLWQFVLDCDCLD